MTKPYNGAVLLIILGLLAIAQEALRNLPEVVRGTPQLSVAKRAIAELDLLSREVPGCQDGQGLPKVRACAAASLADYEKVVAIQREVGRDLEIGLTVRNPVFCNDLELLQRVIEIGGTYEGPRLVTQVTG